MRGVSIEPRDPQKLVDRYLSGESLHSLAFDFGYTTTNAITTFLKHAGVRLRTKEENRALLKASKENR